MYIVCTGLIYIWGTRTTNREPIAVSEGLCVNFSNVTGPLSARAIFLSLKSIRWKKVHSGLVRPGTHLSKHFCPVGPFIRGSCVLYFGFLESTGHFNQIFQLTKLFSYLWSRYKTRYSSKARRPQEKTASHFIHSSFSPWMARDMSVSEKTSL